MPKKKHHPYPGEILLEDILPTLQIPLAKQRGNWASVVSPCHAC